MATDIAVAVVGEISKYLVGPIVQRIGYLIYFKDNVESLKNELKKLSDERIGVQRRVDDATNNMKEINPVVKTWLNCVDAIQDEGDKIIQGNAHFPKGSFREWCFSLKLRYVLSKDAKRKTQKVVELQKERNFENVALPTRPKPFVVSTSTKKFRSRELIFNEIIKNLKDDNVNIIGICGMGGVGKKTMLEEVFRIVTEESLFEEYAKITMMQKMEPTKVQHDIAYKLGLKFEDDDPDQRGSLLSRRLEGNKILIVLFNVWEEFYLEGLGISLQGGQKKCKIIYTSSNLGLWKVREDKRDVLLDVLPEEEAEDLFREKVGFCIDEKVDLKPPAKDIIKECAGLPLALVTLGSELRGKSRHTWNDALLKLKTGQDVHQRFYEYLKPSYDHLVNDEAKSLLLLCSLFEKNSKILVESLVGMGMGLRLFKGIGSIDAARNRTVALLEQLSNCCLVSWPEMSSLGYRFIKVHNIVRGVSKFIASMEGGALVLEPGVELIGSDEEGKLESSVWLSVLSKEIKELSTSSTNLILELATSSTSPRLELPPSSAFPRLKLLHYRDFNSPIPDSCFQGIFKLEVLDITCSVKIPSSLHLLTCLRTLSLSYCLSEDLAAIGNLRSLEILRISNVTVEVLPKEIGYLTNLLLLDVSDYNGLSVSPGIISCLVRLEELYLAKVITKCQEKENEEGTKTIRRVLVLNLSIEDPSVLPRLPIGFRYLTKFQILVGAWKNDVFGYFSRDNDKMLAISFNTDAPLERMLKLYFLVLATEVLVLGTYTKDLARNFILEGSGVIKHLKLTSTDIPKYLWNTMDNIRSVFTHSPLESLCVEYASDLSQIIYGPVPAGSFTELKDLKIKSCRQLTNTFSLPSTAVSDKLEFHKLEALHMEDLQTLVSFCDSSTEIEFHRLKDLQLRSIYKLSSCIFLKSTDPSSDPSPSLFSNKVSFPSVEKITIRFMKIMEIWGGPLQAGSFQNLVELNVSHCFRLKKLFSLGMAIYLVKLQTLDVCSCKSLKEIVSKEEEYTEKSTAKLFPKLKIILLEDMLVLERFCHTVHDLEFSMLEEVRIKNCPKIQTFASGNVHTPKIHGVKLSFSGHEEKLWKSNLNDTIQHLHERQQQ